MNRVAVVTGGSRGIGRAICVQLGADDWTVVVNYRSDAEAAKQTLATIENAGGSAVLAQADVADSADVERLFAIADDAGDLDVLVNNAGVTRDGLSMKMRRTDWDTVVATNLTAAFTTTQHALRRMLRRRAGRVVNVASVVGVRGNAGQANYAAAKAGLVGLTRSVAREVAKRGITVNAVAPGFVSTSMTAGLDPAHVDALIAQTPAARAVTAGEVAAAVAFLASPAASGITGQVLCVDGGMTA